MVIPEPALVTDDIIEIENGDPAAAPAPLPGDLAAGLWRLGTSGGLSRFADAVSLRLPFFDADHNGFVDGCRPPQLDETELTLWYHDSTQVWISLPEATVITDRNVAVVDTDRIGLFGIFRATDGRVGTVGDASADIDLTGFFAGAAASFDSTGWQIPGVDITAPLVATWDATRFADGESDLRVVCGAIADDLIIPQGATSGRGNAGGCFIGAAAEDLP